MAGNRPASQILSADPIRHKLDRSEFTSDALLFSSSTMPTPKLKLSNGSEIEVVGFGTWKSPIEDAAKAVECALRAGYRVIDCAWYPTDFIRFL